MSSRALDRGVTPAGASLEALRDTLAKLERRSGATALALSLYDLETGITFRHQADRWFHAASTIKIAILLGVYATVHSGAMQTRSRLHVRNRFYSAYDGSPYRVGGDRDANSVVHDAIGKTMRISELAHHMIATSSNLATNLLFDLEILEVDGVDVRRGVEDEEAFAHGINNRVTADGLVALLRAIAEERAFSPALSREMVDILHGQEFRRGIPARLPRGARVAHKTGEISTVAHDAGIVYFPDRKPYVIAILTEWEPEVGGRSDTIAKASRAVYEQLVQGDG